MTQFLEYLVIFGGNFIQTLREFCATVERISSFYQFLTEFHSILEKILLNLLQTGEEGHATGEEPGGSVRIRMPHSLRPRIPVVRSFRNCPPKGGQEDSHKQLVFNCYDSIHNICFYVLETISAA